MDQLICLCASHIHSLDRFNLLKNMIESWDNQTIKIKMFISISSNNELKDIIINFLDKYELLTYYYNDEQLKQFQHYKNILHKS